jgi:hypothetical protein
MANLDISRLLANPPKLHQHPDGGLIADWRIDDRTVMELHARVAAGMKTIETGAGLSTILFAAHGCDHTCIAPDPELLDRIRYYCDQAGVDYGRVDFITARSRDVIHQLPEGQFDLALIDGCHGFPTAYVDFCYAALLLRTGGLLLIDDLHIYTCRSIADFMQSDPAWEVQVRTERFALASKVEYGGGVDGEWAFQQFVLDRSRGCPGSIDRKRAESIKNIFSKLLSRQ